MAILDAPSNGAAVVREAPICYPLQVDRRLDVLLLRREGVNRGDIAILSASLVNVSAQEYLVSVFQNRGSAFFEALLSGGFGQAVILHCNALLCFSLYTV